MNYYRRYVGDFQKDTGHLSLMEIGAYDRLLDHYYATDGTLPTDPERLARICGAITAPEREAVIFVADRFFPASKADGSRRNKRADAEIKTALQTIDKQRKSGHESAVKRWVGDGSTDTVGDGSTHKVQDGSTDGSTMQPPTTNHQPLSLSPKPPTSEPTSKAVRGSRLPQDWTPAKHDVAFFIKHRPDLDLQVTMERFRDYWIAQPGSKGVKLDWSATWRNWVRTETAVRVQKGRQSALEAHNDDVARRFVQRHANDAD